jgi:CelD/BcsL family acetyltransferase involved in cellulose biosynthesis
MRTADRLTTAADIAQYSSLEELEDARCCGVLVGWEALLGSDPTATLLQGPAWCMEWYRCYADQFAPLVLAATCEGELVGLAPLAREHGSGRLVFAGDNMADYRDVVAAPGHRVHLIAALLALYRAENPRGPFRIGPTHPESPTTAIIQELAEGTSGIRMLLRAHPCWRLELNGDGKSEEVLRKKSVRQTLKYYQRIGSVSFDTIRTGAEWAAIKDEFYDLHSLRQLQAGRPVSFHDPRKRELFDRMICDNPTAVHICVLRVDGRIVAGHYGCRHDGILYWGLPVHDVRESKRSPGLVLIALLMQAAEGDGLRGIDFTLGTEDYKSRVGNRCVTLPTAEVYAAPLHFHMRRIRDAVIDGAKRLTRWLGDDTTWERVREQVARTYARVGRARELGAAGAVSAASSQALRRVWRVDRWLIHTLTPAELLEPALRLARGEVLSISNDEPRVLLRCREEDKETRRAILNAVQTLTSPQREGRTLHAVLVNGSLAAWGWSERPRSSLCLSETGIHLPSEANSVSLHGFYTVPSQRGKRLYPMLLAAILSDRFSEGAQRAYVMCSASDQASRSGIAAAGFRLYEVHEVARRLWTTTRRRLSPSMGGPGATTAVENAGSAFAGIYNPLDGGT